MREPGKGRKCVLEYGVRRLRRELRNKPDAAALGIESGIQQSLVQIGGTMHRETVHCPRRGRRTRWARGKYDEMTPYVNITILFVKFSGGHSGTLRGLKRPDAPTAGMPGERRRLY